MKIIKTILFFGLLLAASQLFSQILTQTVRGLVVDRDTRQPLIGATVRIADLGPAMGAATDLDGSFSIKNIPVGRHRVECSFLGYEPFVSDNLVVNSAKEVVLNIELLEALAPKSTTGEAVITARKQGNEPLNELAAVSTRSFSVDETQRYAASANDPGRMAMGFPGVQVSRDSRSDIVVRGNSGIGLAWRLEGIDIPNPNHFARVGTSGGGITVFSTSLLGQSDFSTGAFPAEYGSATSGVFDIKFRKGNADKREHTFKAGLLGLDFATEGPFKKGSRASYLVNYRYSTLGILNKMGIHLVGPRTDNTFQDLSLNLNFPSKNNRDILGVWGIGGVSKEVFSAKKQADWQSFDDYHEYDFTTKMGAVGLTQTHLIGDDAFLKTSLAAMAQTIEIVDDTLDLNLQPGIFKDQNYLEGRYSLASVFNKKLSPRAGLKIGGSVSRIFYDLKRREYTSLGAYLPDIYATGHPWLVEPFVNLRLRPTERLTANLGLHFTYFSINKKSKAVEPRVNLSYQLADNQRVSVAYGLHSRYLPLGTYEYIQWVGGTDYSSFKPNTDLPLLKAHHAVAAYDLRLRGGFKIHPELYFQRLFDVPVAEAEGVAWSLLNTTSGFPSRILESTGTGTNYGLDLSIEKAFDRSFFLILGGSIFRSRYTDGDGREHPTIFDSGFSASCMGGKEWNLTENGVFQLGWKILANGGQRLSPLLPGQPVDRYQQDPPIDEHRPFTEEVDPYFRPDARLAWRQNGRKAAWTLALDVQNFMNRKNIDAISRTYDPDRNEWVFRKQSGLTPVLSFQIDL